MIINSTDKKNIRKLFKIIFKYKRQHFLAALFMLVNSLLTIISPYIIMKIIDYAIPNKNLELLIKFMIIYLVVMLFENGSRIISDYMYSIIGKKIVYDLRLKLIRRLQKFSGTYYSNIDTGELLTTVNSDVDTIEHFSTKMLFSIISDICTSIVMFIFLCGLQFDLLIVAIILQPVMFYFQSKFSKKINKIVTNLRDKYGEFTSIIEEFISSMMNFVVQNARKHFFARYFPTSRKILEDEVKLELNFSLSMASANIISSLITIAVLGYGGYKVMLGKMTLGTLIAFNTYSQRLLGPVFRIAHLKTSTRRAFVAIERIFKVLDEPINIQQVNYGYRPNYIIGSIQFKHVKFSYTEGNYVIKDMNINFQEKKTTAVVGASGSGKTTLINLMLRLWDVDEGAILLDGKNIKEYNLKFLRKNISVVSQDVFIFNDTILNNLVLSNGNIEMNDIIKATKAADIYDFIMSLSEQFDTVVGQRGLILSGGQKQKISIARAILRDAPIIILDEATSSLDNISEFYVKNNLESFIRNKTVIVIAHRLSTVEDADIIYTIKDGRIVENGTHDELMKLKNVYYNLYMKNVS